MKRNRRNHSPKFKAKVAVGAMKGARALVELAQHFDVHPTQIQHWKAKVKELRAKIKQLTMERDFLSAKLGG